MAEKKHIQRTLTPIILEAGMPGYETVQDIEAKLNDSEVFNIAITGPYGSGKSTVLKSLMALYPNNHKYLTISLASLTGNNDEEDDIAPEEQQKVEYSLLQQLIYKEKPETLPNSRFRRIGRRSVLNAVWFGLSIIAFIVCFAIVFEPKWMRVDTFCQLFNLGQIWNLVADLLCSAYMLLFMFKLAAYTYRRSVFSRIRALHLKDVKIELNQDSSVFNKHLEEIVYFFESTDYNVVIIEDLDRFRCPEIFQKLREINFLLRQSEVLKEEKRYIKFIYAIKDDLFKDAERTKFFDYIATVIPVVNPKNSCEKLTQELTDRGYKLNTDTLKDLSEFVDDMRMLKNVANEFQQYMERLSQSSSPNQEMLLAMIIYKNHHPDDFGKLHYKKGKVYEFIKKKSEWTQIAIDKVIKPRLDVWQKKREDVVNSQKFTLKQWRMIYMEKYRQHLPSTLASIAAKGAYHNINEFVDDESLFEELVKLQHIPYKYHQYNSIQNASSEVKFSEIEKEVDDQMGYLKRKDLATTSISEIDTEIRMVRDEENRLKNYKLTKLLIQFPEIKTDDRFVKLGLSELMVHFLQRGYIDETYYDYLTLYDGTTMSLNDRDLLSRIRQNDVNVNFDEKIDDVKAFVEELPLFVYEYKSILNYQVADYLESHPVIYKSALSSFEQHFVASSTPALDFLANYYIKGESGAAKLWSRYVKSKMSWQRIQTYEKQEYWDTLVEAWLSYCEPSDITAGICEWLNNNLGFCIERLEAIGIQHLKELINDCKFADITVLGPIGGQMQGEDVMEVANYILDNNLFELTSNNICVACEITSNPLDEIKGTDYITITDILSSGNNGFREYVKENIKDVFTNIISKNQGQEKEAGLIYILNLGELDEQQKIEYLKQQISDKVVDLNDINDTFKPLAVRSGVLKATWENVVLYLNEVSEKKADEHIIEFVNQHAEELAIQRTDKLEKEEVQNILAQFVSTDNLTFEAFTRVVDCFDNWYYENGGPAVEERRAKVLNEKGMLHYSVKNTESIIERYSASMVVAYLLKHKREWLKQPSDVSYNTDVAIGLMKSSLTISEKASLVQCFDKEILNSELADEIIQILCEQEISLDISFLLKVMKLTKKSGERLRVLNNTLEKNDFDEEMITAFIETLHYPYKNIAVKGKKPEIQNDEESWRLVKILKGKDYISSYSETKNGIRVNTKLK